MKRDNELIRNLAILIEESRLREVTYATSVEGFDDSQISDNLHLMHIGGLIKASPQAFDR
jgi:hypothetical protein